METGLVIDRTYGRVEVSTWIGGLPARGWLGVKVGGKKQYPIQAFRCSSCGYLESYALEP